MSKKLFSAGLMTTLLLQTFPAVAQEQKQSFTDVSAKHFASEAVEYLRQRNMLEGYPDGTFRPQNKVNRAEALKLIVDPLMTDNDRIRKAASPFSDVPANAWYLPYVEWARMRGGIIQAPPVSKTFDAGKNVTKAEFIKMFLSSRGIDPQSFNDVQLALSKDVSNVKEWHYPYMRYAVASSMTAAAQDGLYSPNREISRSDVAIFLHRFFLYRLGQRTQALLSETERELSKTIDALAADNPTGADYTSARALLMMRGALDVRPTEAMVKAVLKVTEGYRSLVRAFRASKEKDWESVVKLAGDAFYLGDQAKKASPNAATLANQLQGYAKSFADQARREIKK